MDLGTENPSAGGRMNSKDKASWIPVWLLYALAGMFFYGVWGIQSKIVMERVSPLANQVLSTPGLLLVTLGLWLRREAGGSLSAAHGAAGVPLSGRATERQTVAGRVAGDCCGAAAFPRVFRCRSR